MQGKSKIKLQTTANQIEFSEREIRILQLIADDKSTPEIAKEICLSVRSVETIRQRMKVKSGFKTIGGMILYAMINKLID
jgi:DNA-binding NarL/FixJ family response regulator